MGLNLTQSSFPFIRPSLWTGVLQEEGWFMHMLAVVALSLGVADLAAAGVERRIVIYSDPPGALVYRNGVPIGLTPVDDHFVYYGKYHFTLVRDKCKTLEVEQKIDPPWYQYLGVDFVTENLVPYKFRDVRYLYYRLEPLQPINQEEFVARAVELKNRSKTIGSAPVPAQMPPVAQLPGNQGVRPGMQANPGAPMPFPPPPAQPNAPLAPVPISSGPVTGGTPASTKGPPNPAPMNPAPSSPSTTIPGAGTSGSGGSTFIPAGSNPAGGAIPPDSSRPLPPVGSGPQ